MFISDLLSPNSIENKPFCIKNQNNKTMTFQPPRGTRDFLPEEMIRRQYILDTVRGVFESFGFVPLDTPAFESWELLSKKGSGGEEIKNEIYYFRDKSDRELGLRFDLTVPLARVIANNLQLQKPFKRYQIGKAWRYDRPQAGRMREFLQADVDTVGTDRMDADTECIAVAAESLKQLGFKKFEVRMNNRKVLNGLVEFAGIPERVAPSVFRVLDKLEKISRKDIISELKKAGIETPKINKLLKLIEVRGEPDITLSRVGKLLRGVGVAEEGLKELEEIVSLLKPYGLDRYIVIDFSLVRGLDYYTGPIFEIATKTKKSIGSVAGGGRYDNLIGLYGGKQIPATGISLGIERIYEIMNSEGMFDLAGIKVGVFVVCVNEKVKKNVLKIARELRKVGVSAETELTGRDMRKQLDYANKKRIPFVLFVGEKELKKRMFTLRDMKTGEQRVLGIKQLIRELSKQN